MAQNERVSKLEMKTCHWCKDELHGLLVEFVHCVRCNERRIIEGLNHTYDPCPVCMTIKSRRLDFLNQDNRKNGDGNYDSV